MSRDIFNLLIAGVGGQGNLFGSRVIAQAAVSDGYSVRIAETYGVTQRGGPVYSQVRIGHGAYGPLIPSKSADLIMGLEPIETLRRAVDYLAPGGTVVINTRVNVPLETKLGKQPNLTIQAVCAHLGQLGAGTILQIDALRIAEQSGGAATSNLVMIGVLSAIPTFPLRYESLRKALEATTPKAYLSQNMLALEQGREFAFSARDGAI